jgi:hypothetical protein
MGRRVTVSLRYIDEFRDRHGHVRRYFRRPGGKRVPLPGNPGSREFMDAYNAALVGEPEPIGVGRHDPRSVAAGVALYLASAKFAEHAPDTRRTRKNELERFRVEHGDRMLSTLDRDTIERLVAKKKPNSGRNFLKALSPFLEWCKVEKLIASNPAIGVKRPTSPNKDGYKPWTVELVDRYRSHHAIGTKPRQAFELLVNVGAARVDIAALGRQHVRNGMLTYRRNKTGVLVEIPILHDLQAVIDQMAGDNLAFIATDRGTPYTKESFGNMFRDWCDAAGIPKGYSAHGIRKYAATLRADLGASVLQLMAWFGWLTMREAERYTRSADRRRAAIALGDIVNPKFPTP